MRLVICGILSIVAAASVAGCGGSGGSSGGARVRVTTTAVGDVIVTIQSQGVRIDVLINDLDGAGRGLTIVAFTQGAIGTVTDNGDGTLQYTPDLHRNGADQFDYTVEDARGVQSTGTVDITITPVTVAVDDAVVTPEDNAIRIGVLDNDTDGSQAGIAVDSFTNAANGTLRLNGDGTITYTPDLDFFGVDRFTYTIIDTVGDRATGTVDIQVTAVNDVPELLVEVVGAIVSRGGWLHLEVTSRDPDNVASIDLFADEDGDFGTDADQFAIGDPLVEMDGQTEEVRVDLSALPLGTYTIFGVANDFIAPPVVEAAIDDVEYSNVASASRAGGAAFDEATGVASFADGSYVVVGFFSGQAVFAAGEPEETTLTSAGGTDIFLAKYAGNGRLIWARRAGGAGDDAASGVDSFADGSVAITGVFTGNAVFGAGEANETTLSFLHGKELFCAKFDADGNLAWARAARGVDLSATGDEGFDVAAFDDGSVVVVGAYELQITFAEGTADERVLLARGRRDVCIARYAANGTLVFATSAGGLGEDQGLSVAGFDNGAFVVCGRFFDVAVFGTGEANETALAATGVDDVFVARFNAAGLLQWARRGGGAAAEAAHAIDSFPDGSCVITGEFFGLAVFGEGGLNETALVPAAAPDIFIARFTQSGDLGWAKRAGGGVSGVGDRGHGITALVDGSCVVTGFFETDAVFGSGEPHATLLETTTSASVFVARLGADGTLEWAVSADGQDLGSEGDRGAAVASFPDGSTIVTGSIDRFATFGRGDPGEVELDSGAATDAFMARYNADGEF